MARTSWHLFHILGKENPQKICIFLTFCSYIKKVRKSTKMILLYKGFKPTNAIVGVFFTYTYKLKGIGHLVSTISIMPLLSHFSVFKFFCDVLIFLKAFSFDFIPCLYLEKRLSALSQLIPILVRRRIGFS